MSRKDAENLALKEVEHFFDDHQISLISSELPLEIGHLCETNDLVYINPSFSAILGNDEKIQSVVSHVFDKQEYKLDKTQTTELHYLLSNSNRLIRLSCSYLKEEQVFSLQIEEIQSVQEKIQQYEIALSKAEELARRNASFLANMSHDVRTPLTSILGFASVLSEELIGTQKEFAGLIEESAKRLLETLNSVLDLARLESEGMELRAKQLYVPHEIEQILEMLQPLATAKRLELRIEKSDSQAYTKLDATCFNRVMTNILSNALKFTHKGGVYVSIETDEHLVTIRVRDTGIGISQQFLPYLFQEFKQEQTVAYASKREGAGLGLAIARRLLDMMGGGITVSTEKGKGSIFEIFFPLTSYSPEEEESLEEPEETFISLLRLDRVIIIENDEPINLLIEHILAPYCTVDCVHEVAEAFPLLHTHHYDCILIDVNLGFELSGMDLVKEIRKLDNYANTPILALTAYATPTDRDQFIEDGFDEYLSKPFTRNTLLKTLNSLVT